MSGEYVLMRSTEYDMSELLYGRNCTNCRHCAIHADGVCYSPRPYDAMFAYRGISLRNILEHHNPGAAFECMARPHCANLGNFPFHRTTCIEWDSNVPECRKEPS